MRILGIILSLVVCSPLWSQIPKAENGTFALTNATLNTITGGVIEKGTLLIQDGKITGVGNVTIPQDAKVIDCTGKQVYPGFIDGGTKLGLSEIGSDPRTQDYNEVGALVPQMKALTAVNPNSALIPVTRVNGVTTVLAVPRGGLLCGTAGLINLNGYTPEQMSAGFEGIVLEFPSKYRKSNDARTDEEVAKAFQKELDQLNEIWDRLIQYHKLDSATKGEAKYYPEMEALLPVLRNEMALLIEVNYANDITTALEWVAQQKLKRVILTGVAEGWRVAEAIAAADLPVVTGPVIELPTRSYDRYDRPYSNAAVLVKAGVKLAIRTNHYADVRNLPYQAGFATTYGLSRDQAIRAITINPAEIFGVDKRMGSLEVGKEANLFVCDGDPFETKTQVHHLFIQGYRISLETRHTQLYDEFLHRDQLSGK